MTREERKDKLARILSEKGLYVNFYEPDRLEWLLDMCRLASWYNTMLDNANRKKAESISFTDLVEAFESSGEPEGGGYGG